LKSQTWEESRHNTFFVPRYGEEEPNCIQQDWDTHFDHTWLKCPTPVGPTIIMDYNLTQNNMKSHVRVEFRIAGMKILQAGEPMRFISFVPDDISRSERKRRDLFGRRKE
jgi:hypothetical protein